MKKEEIEFLNNLQKELQTQSNDGNADPVFWVVADYKWEKAPEGDGERIGVDFPDIQEYFLLSEYRQNVLNGTREMGLDGEEYVELYNAETDWQIKSWIEEHEADKHYFYEETESHFVVPNTFFITKKGCQAHIKSNSHNYTSKVHTYAMTAQRSLLVSQLWDILKNADWAVLESQEKEIGEKEIGDECPECSNGILDFEDGTCFCNATNYPPCSYCENAKLKCDECGYKVER